MIIDFHTHLFPDSIADKSIATLEGQSNAKAFIPATVASLKESMNKYNIDYSVVLPVVTHPNQFDSINHFAADINGKDGIFSLGGIHPKNDNIKEKLEYIKSLGLKGVKLHPDYQDSYIDDTGYIEILKTCIALDLICVIHAGLDIGKPYPIHCPPDRIYMVLQEVLKNCYKDSKIILAHMGGYLQWQLVEKCLVQQNVYFDLAFCKNVIDRDMLIRIIKNHGSNHILYATDSPWAKQNDMIEYVKGLPLSETDKENIFYRNGAKLLDIT